MGNIEHLIGIRRAGGYDEADVRELVESLNARPSVAFAVELTEPAATQGIVQALQTVERIVEDDWYSREARTGVHPRDEIRRVIAKGLGR